MDEQYFYRDVWAEIDLDAVGENMRTFRKHLPAETKIMAVVKADGYGHGAFQIANKALREGAEWLAVALLDEALELRIKGITAPILVLSSFPARGIALALQHDIAMTVYQIELLEEIIRQAEAARKKARVHIKLDTGMGRIGIREGRELSAFAARCQSEWIEVEGVFTHFATADEENQAYTMEQMRRYEELVACLEAGGIHPALLYTNNTAATMFYPDKSRHIIRLGISLYGQYPSSYMKKTGMKLHPVFQWKARLSHVKHVPAGTKISYGATHITTNEAVIATVPVGYADGYNRLLSNRGEVLIHGQRAPIVGRVCMDQFMVDVTGIEGVAVGDEAVLIGRQGSEEITVDEMADWLTTINYEVTCMVSRRVPRVYVENGVRIAMSNPLLSDFCKQ
ncbi:alanine racemase [Aneurinibacillus uraniidurans]|uniref:alanine racemase n=1 Tax=Aneurinibacillus uraniidurans TaxID=2966586 RepID=UPI00234B2771|nr:alanine racemase [Aneurinibacillus sp. B1]WCN37526.1 alanine racemase [Aneurinibacillus sp. B1]